MSDDTDEWNDLAIARIERLRQASNHSHQKNKHVEAGHDSSKIKTDDQGSFYEKDMYVRFPAEPDSSCLMAICGTGLRRRKRCDL